LECLLRVSGSLSRPCGASKSNIPGYIRGIMCKILFNTSGVVDCIHAITMDVTMDIGIGCLRRLNLNITISQIKMYIKGSTEVRRRERS